MFHVVSQPGSLLLQEPSRQGTSLNSHLGTPALQLRNHLPAAPAGAAAARDEAASTRHHLISTAQENKKGSIHSALVYSEIPVLPPPSQHQASAGPLSLWACALLFSYPPAQTRSTIICILLSSPRFSVSSSHFCSLMLETSLHICRRTRRASCSSPRSYSLEGLQGFAQRDPHSNSFSPTPFAPCCHAASFPLMHGGCTHSGAYAISPLPLTGKGGCGRAGI